MSAGARPIRIGAQLQPQHATYAELRRACADMEEIGVDVVFTWDHFSPLYGPADGPHFECWTTLAAWAEATERVEIGALVTCNSYRNPNLLADMARTVDHISDGRLILGIGSGWFERDYDEYGYDFGTAVGRLHQLGTSLPRIKARLGKLHPGPVDDSLPILIGGSGEKVTLRLVADHADAWNTFGPPDNYRKKNEILNNWCAELGRDPSEIERTVGIGVDDLDRLDEYLDVGAEHLILMCGHPYDFSGLERILAFAEV